MQAIVVALIGLIEIVVREFPAIASEIRAVMDMENPTPEDWQALRDKAAEKSYANYVPGSGLPK